MKVLIAIDTRGCETLATEASQHLPRGAELICVHVIDSGPRHHMHHLHGPLRHHKPPHERDRQMNASEEAAGKEALDEAVKNSQATGATSHSVLRRGEPGHEIVEAARELNASLIVLRARKHPDHHPKH